MRQGFEPIQKIERDPLAHTDSTHTHKQNNKIHNKFIDQEWT